MPEIGQLTIKFPTLLVILAGLIGGVWWAAIEMTNIRRDIAEIKSKIGSRWRLTDQQWWCREAERLNKNWNCPDLYNFRSPMPRQTELDDSTGAGP